MNQIQPLKYNNSFDGIRGFAVILVGLFHGSYGYFPGGFIGVDLFFVLSGYLITSLLHIEYVSSGTLNLSRFYLRRALRLIPALIVCVVLSNILWPYTVLMPGHIQSVATLSALFYFTNFLFDYVCGNMAHLWSLAVEEHFYFMWPATVLFVLFVRPLRSRIRIMWILIILFTLFRIVVLQFKGELAYGIFQIDPYLFTFCRIDSILIGAQLFFVLSDRDSSISVARKSTDTIVIITLLLALVTFSFLVEIYSPLWLGGGFVLTNLICVWIVFIAIRNPNHKLLANQIIGWVGKRSYGIYLFHFPIFLALETFRTPQSMSNFLLVSLLRFGLSFGFAALSYALVERPILRLKSKLKPVNPAL